VKANKFGRVIKNKLRKLLLVLAKRILKVAVFTHLGMRNDPKNSECNK
jgi:hypothetical protein